MLKQRCFITLARVGLKVVADLVQPRHQHGLALLALIMLGILNRDSHIKGIAFE